MSSSGGVEIASLTVGEHDGTCSQVNGRALLVHTGSLLVQLQPGDTDDKEIRENDGCPHGYSDYRTYVRQTRREYARQNERLVRGSKHKTRRNRAELRNKTHVTLA